MKRYHYEKAKLVLVPCSNPFTNCIVKNEEGSLRIYDHKTQKGDNFYNLIALSYEDCKQGDYVYTTIDGNGFYMMQNINHYLQNKDKIFTVLASVQHISYDKNGLICNRIPIIGKEIVELYCTQPMDEIMIKYVTIDKEKSLVKFNNNVVMLPVFVKNAYSIPEYLKEIFSDKELEFLEAKTPDFINSTEINNLNILKKIQNGDISKETDEMYSELITESEWSNGWGITEQINNRITQNKFSLFLKAINK